MTERVLHGTRYLDRATADLGRYILSDLHDLTYEATLDFYREMLNRFTHKDIALLACNDRFFLLTAVLGRGDAIHPWLFARTREVEANPDGYLDLWAREHYKSTIITFAGIIQEIIRDPEITAAIFAFNKSIAQGFLGQIKGEMENNEILHRSFPDVFWTNPKTEAPSWSLARGITVKRKTNPKEPTVSAWGLVDGMPTSMHFGLMNYDDIVTDKTVNNPEQVQRATVAWELSDNLGAGEVRKRYAGTRYSFADPYGLMMDRKAVVPRIYPATENGEIEGKLVFMSPKRWKEKVATQRATLSAQMLQNPIAGRENMFQPVWFRPWEVRPSILNVYIMVDPSGGNSTRASGKSRVDRTAMAVVGIDGAGNRYLLDGYRHRMSLSKRWEALRGLYLKWNVGVAPGVRLITVGYEKYGMQADLDYMKIEMAKKENPSFDVIELNWSYNSGQSKKDRVGRLEPDFRRGRFLLPGVIHGEATKRDGSRYLGDCLWRVDPKEGKFSLVPMQDGGSRMMQDYNARHMGYRVAKSIKRVDEDGKIYDVTRALIEEMTFFPFAPHDDLVDALSRLYDLDITGPQGSEEPDKVEDLQELVYDD